MRTLFATVCLSVCIVLLPRTVFGQVPGVTDNDRALIDSQIKALRGVNYELADVVNVDSSIGKRIVADGRLEDPYGTLTHCYIFAAQGIDTTGNPPRGFIGVFKAGQVVWLSDTLMNSVDAGDIEIYGTRDLNKGGTVDIMTSWGEGTNHTVCYLWIFSWDGSVGHVINDYGADGHSVIVTVDHLYDIVDVNGDGVCEIAVNLSNSSYSQFGNVVYSWNGQKYGKWPNPPQPPAGGFLPKNQFTMSIKPVIRSNGTSFSFRYIIANDRVGTQRISEIDFERRSTVIQSLGSPRAWDFNLGDVPLFGWGTIDYQSAIPQGTSDSTMSIQSPGLPCICAYYAQGYNPNPNEPDNLNAWYQDLLTNSVRGSTIGPCDPPNPLVASIFLDTLSTYSQRASRLGWIDNQGIANSLDQKLENAKSQLQKGNTTAARNALQALVNEVEAQNGKHLSSEAYALMKFNAEYLISKLQ